jgi:serine/threonine-protein kinase RsbW
MNGTGGTGTKSGRTTGAELLIKLQLVSNPVALSLVRATLERATQLLHFTDSDSRAIVRSVDEALANVMRHAYQGKKDLPIEITCWKLQREHGAQGASIAGIEILLEDGGIPVDSAKLKGRALEEIRPGGLGLHFMRQSMDVVEFGRKNDKNQLRMVKYLTPASAANKPEGE